MKTLEILLVDSDIVSFFLLHEVLEKKDIHVVYTQNGIEAVDRLIRHPYTDLIITELVLPDQTGFTLLKKFRDINPNIPVIAMTSYVMQETRYLCKSEGFDDFIEKPVQIEKIERKIEYYTQKQRFIPNLIRGC